MDEIQKVLVKAGRKDLAQKYYEKTSTVSQAIYDNMINDMLNAVWGVAESYNYDTKALGATMPFSAEKALEKIFPIEHTRPVKRPWSRIKIDNANS